MQVSIAEFPVTRDRDIKAAAQRARLLGTLAELSDRRRTAFGRAVREVAQNAVVHAGQGHIAFGIVSQAGTTFIQASISDNATGLQEIQAILAEPVGPNCGLLRAAAAADKLTVEALSDGRKTIIVSMAVAASVASISDTDLSEWTGILRTRQTQSALANTQRRSRELAEQLASIQRQRQQLEVELQQSQSLNETLTLLSLVASKTDNAVIIMDDNGLITWVNDAFIRMTGYALPDAVGTRPESLLAGPETNRDAIQALENAFQLGHGVSEELLQYRREGTTSWISLSLTPVHDDYGDVVRWIGIGSDVTRRREAQKALETARDAAEKASRLKGDFLANISHEIRTPMNSIIGMTELTLCTHLSGDQREYLSTVKQSAEALLELLNDVLDLSRIEAGRLEIHETAFDLRELVTETLKPLTFMAEQKNLTLTFHIAADVPRIIMGDALRLRQILVNLTGNAIKFTNQGSVNITIQKQWESEGNLGLQFTVADTGIGIPANKLEQIFDAFSQADSSITRQFGGTGLGLAIAAELLSLMKGRIWVQSEVGIGSRFHFSLRSRLPSADDLKNAASAATARAATSDISSHNDCDPPPRTTARVLVADDHPANQQLIAKILQKRGHSYRIANDGKDVVALYRQETFDVILMDIQMPEVDGFQATRVIRDLERETQTHVPIVAVTAHAMQGDRDACVAAGMDAYLSKPIAARQLIALVEGFSEGRTGGSPTRVPRLPVRPDRSVESDTFAPELVLPGRRGADEFQMARIRLDNDEDLLREQMQFFLKDGPELLQVLQQAIGDRNSVALQIAAHRLKNLCATFDDAAAARECNDLEVLGRDARFDTAEKQQIQTVTAVTRLLAAVEQYSSSGR